MDRQEWLALRRSGIGGSDAGAILGVDPWRDAADVYAEKLGVAEEREQTGPMLAGVELEPLIADKYAAKTGRRVKRKKMVRHPELGWLIGNIDRQVLTAANAPAFGPGVLECKAVGLSAFQKIKDVGLPENYILQVQHYLAATGYLWGSFAILQRERWEFLSFDVLRDEALIERLIAAEQDFWMNHVLKEIPPNASLPKLDAGEALREDEPWLAALRALKGASDVLKEAEALKAGATEEVKALMGGLGKVRSPLGQVSWAEREGRTSYKVEKCLAEHPDLAVILDNYKSVGKPYQDFRFTTKEE